MIQKYKKEYITDEEFEKIEFKNTTCSEITLGKLMFDQYLFSCGFKAKGIRNKYHPNSVFFNPKTKEEIDIYCGVRKGDKHRDFYISIGGILYEVPANEKDIELFKNGFLKVLFSE